MIEISKKLEKLRKLKGLTQAEAAKRIGTSQQRWSQWEKGARKPTYKDLQLISKEFNASLDYLINDFIQLNNAYSGMLILPIYNSFPFVAEGSVVLGSMPTPHQIIGIDVPSNSIWVAIQNNDLQPFATEGMALLARPMESIEELSNGDVIALMDGEKPDIRRAYIAQKELNLISETNKEPILIKTKELFVKYPRIFKILFKGCKP